MKQKRAGLYARVSTDDQNTDAQELALLDYARRRGWSISKLYKDKGISGVMTSRPALDELMRDCRHGAIDVVVVWKFDRFARSLRALISALELFKALGVDFVSVTESIDTALPAGELVFHIFGAVAQFERTLIGERVRAGLDHARKKGKVLGRPPLRRLTAREIAELRKERARRNSTFRELAQKFGVSVWTAHRLCSRRPK